MSINYAIIPIKSGEAVVCPEPHIAGVVLYNGPDGVAREPRLHIDVPKADCRFLAIDTMALEKADDDKESYQAKKIVLH